MKMETVHFETVSKDLSELRTELARKGKLEELSYGNSDHTVGHILDQMCDYHPRIVSCMMRYRGIFYYVINDKQSYDDLTKTLTPYIVKHTPHLKSQARVYYYLDKNQHIMVKPELNNMLRVINSMIRECHQIPQQEREDVKMVIKQEHKVQVREQAKKDNAKANQNQKKHKIQTKRKLPIDAPFPYGDGYDYSEVMRWHVDETGDNIDEGYLVIGDYKPKSRKPYLVPAAHDYSSDTQQFVHVDYTWMSGYEIRHLSHFPGLFNKYTMPLTSAVHFQTNPYWMIIDTTPVSSGEDYDSFGTGVNSMEQQLEYFRFCMMLNGDGNGQKQSMGA